MNKGHDSMLRLENKSRVCGQCLKLEAEDNDAGGLQNRYLE